MLAIGLSSPALAQNQLPDNPALAITAYAPAQDGDQSIASELELRATEIRINGLSIGSMAFIGISGQDIFAKLEDAKSWRLRTDKAPIHMMGGRSYIKLADIPGIDAHIETREQILDIDANPRSFIRTEDLIEDTYHPVDTPMNALFVNYSLDAFRSENQTSLSGLIDGGISGKWGAVHFSALGSGSDDGQKFRRLETTYVHDDPEKGHRLVLGDTVSTSSGWNQPIRYAGVRYGTDFGLNPDRITYPIPSVQGEAALPSTVDLLTSQSRRTSSSVQPGAFDLEFVPPSTGAGEVTMVVRDAQGIQRRVTSNYYFSNELLRPDITQFSVEAGFERHYYGERSFDYGKPFAAASMRKGLSSNMTLAARAEANRSMQGFGAGLSAVVGKVGEFSISGALSKSPFGTGANWSAQARRITSDYSLLFRYEQSSPKFAQIGAVDINSFDLRKKQQFTAGASLALGRFGQLGGNWTMLKGYSEKGSKSRFATLSYNLPLSNKANFSLGVQTSKFDDMSRDNRLFGSITMSLGPRKQISTRYDGRRFAGEYRQTPPTDRGLGFHMLTQGNAAGEDTSLRGGIDLRTGFSDISLDMAQERGETAFRGNIRGAVIIAGGEVAMTRHFDSAFAIVDLPGQDDVTIYHENNPVAHTSATGRAIVTGLRPYEINKISFESDDLPFSTIVDAEELALVPGYQNGVKARFAISQARPTTLIVVDAMGNYLPAGSTALLAGKTHIVGNDGELFLDDIGLERNIRVNTGHNSCNVHIPTYATSGIMPQIGPLKCNELRISGQ